MKYILVTTEYIIAKIKVYIWTTKHFRIQWQNCANSLQKCHGNCSYQMEKYYPQTQFSNETKIVRIATSN